MGTKDVILIHDVPLREGRIVERLNRFTLEVRFDNENKEVYLPNPGEISTVLEKNRKILCEPKEKKHRKTKFDAFAIKKDEFFVTIDSRFANTIFLNAVEKELLPEFENYSILSREPPLPDHGRADFKLREDGKETETFVEVKSCTHVEKGIAKFPDRPTKRGRRHLKSLRKITNKGKETHFVFAIQRPDARKFKPFQEVDRRFADLLENADNEGVNLHAFSTRFEPPNLKMENRNISIELP